MSRTRPRDPILSLPSYDGLQHLDLVENDENKKSTAVPTCELAVLI